jgi:hypothetical protein
VPVLGGRLHHDLFDFVLGQPLAQETGCAAWSANSSARPQVRCTSSTKRVRWLCLAAAATDRAGELRRRGAGVDSAQAGRAVKTNRRDARKLAELGRAGPLTAVQRHDCEDRRARHAIRTSVPTRDPRNHVLPTKHCKCALLRATVVTTVYQRHSSSKRPRSSVVPAAQPTVASEYQVVSTASRAARLWAAPSAPWTARPLPGRRHLCQQAALARHQPSPSKARGLDKDSFNISLEIRDLTPIDDGPIDERSCKIEI